MTKEERALFGAKVRCSKYLKINGFSRVDVEDLYKEDVDSEVTRDKRVLVNEDFEGIIIGTLNVVSSYVFGITYHNYTSSEIVYIDEKKYTRCYKVAYQNNKTRYVPVEFCEVITND